MAKGGRGISDLFLREDLQGESDTLPDESVLQRMAFLSIGLGDIAVPLASGDTNIVQIDRSILLRRSYANIGGYVALTKPRVMLLVVFTAFVGLMVAPGGIDPFAGAVAVLCIAAEASGLGSKKFCGPEPKRLPLAKSVTK